MIETGSQVTLHYTLTLDDGSVVDTTEDREPLEYQHGDNRLLPAFENALEGLAPGAEKEITLPPEEAYGPVNPEAFTKVPTDAVPEDLREVDMMLMAQDGEGNQQPVRVHEVEDEHVVLDWNHPLAGQTLHFKLRVLDVDQDDASGGNADEG